MAAARILIVEDERLVAHALQRRLTRMGYTVVSLAASGAEAVDKAHSLRPDLVLLDIHLQGRMDGIEAAQLIQTSLGIPVVFMTAYVDEVTLQRARSTAPWGCLRKPVDSRTLQATLRRALGTPPQGQP
jgi:CheY-like chemotaxis protein